MSKHVQGPWHVDSAKPWQIVLRSEKTNMLRVASVNTQFTASYPANARLMAASPEMLEALREALEYFEERADAEYLPTSAAPVGNREMRLAVEIRAAIAKAEGRK